MTRQQEETEGRKPYTFFSLTTGQPCNLECKDSIGTPDPQDPYKKLTTLSTYPEAPWATTAFFYFSGALELRLTSFLPETDPLPC